MWSAYDEMLALYSCHTQLLSMNVDNIQVTRYQNKQILMWDNSCYLGNKQSVISCMRIYMLRALMSVFNKKCHSEYGLLPYLRVIQL